MKKLRIREQTSEPRKDTLCMKVSKSERALLYEAAAIEEVAPSTFVAETALAKARRLVKKRGADSG